MLRRPANVVREKPLSDFGKMKLKAKFSENQYKGSEVIKVLVFQNGGRRPSSITIFEINGGSHASFGGRADAT